MILVGLCGHAAQFMAPEGIRRAPASVVAPLEFTALVWSFGLGYAIWGDLPDAAVFIGAGLILMVLFFNLEFSVALLRLAPVLGLGALGFAALATLLAAISGRARGGDLLLPLLAVPMFVPALIAGVRASAATLGGAPLAAAREWIGILVAFDVLFVTAGYLLFEHVVGEE